LDFSEPAGLRLEAFVDSSRIFSAAQFRSMVHDIREVFPGALWDLTEGVPHIGKARSAHDRPDDVTSRIPRLIGELRRESIVAARAVRFRRWEPAPMRPGRPENPRELFSRNHDLAENRAVRLWVRRRLADIDRALNDARAESRGTQLQLDDFGATEVQERAIRVSRVERFGNWLEELGAARNRLRALDGELANRGVTHGSGGSFASTRSEIRSLQARPPLSSIGLSAAESSSDDASPGGDEHPNDNIALRLMSELYELWVAVRCWKIIVDELGFERRSMESDSRVAVIPRRLEMIFVCPRRGELTFEFGPRFTTKKPEMGSLRVAEVDALWREVRGRGESGFFTISASATPDYVVTLRREGATAFCIGDATCTDTTESKWDNTTKKQGTVQDYAKNTILVGPGGHLTRSSGAASFVCVPSPNHRGLSKPSDPLVICATPEDDASLVHGLRSVIESLDWYCGVRAEMGWGGP
jgi:hypothetical protein